VTLSLPSQPEDVFTWHYDPEFGDRPADLDRDIIKPEMKVLVVDELLATGGTAAKAVRLIEELGAEVAGTVFLIELTGLGGRVKIQDYDTISLVQYNY
jgi:adenine phosphoribosyltransferase